MFSQHKAVSPTAKLYRDSTDALAWTWQCTP